MELTHKPCPFCDSSDAFSYSTETGLFSCFSCQATPSSERGLYYGDELVPFNSQDEEEGIYLDTYVKDVYRGISKKVLDKYGVYFTKDSNGKETVHYIYPNATKHRKLPKEEIKTSGTLDAFYGQDDYTSGQRITITEGEEDRLSVIEIMGDWPTVSVPNATPSRAFWKNATKYLSNFKEIRLSLDNDPPGQALAERFKSLFPGKIFIIDHGKYKDANDFLVNSDKEGYKKAWWNAQRIKPENILCTGTDFVDLYKNTPDYQYFKTGVEALDDKMLGIHKGALTLIMAPTGIGKSELMRYLEWQCYSNTDYSLAMCHGEETQLRSMLGLVSYDLQNNVTRKDLVESKGLEDKVLESLEKLGQSDRVFQYSVRVDQGVEDIIETVRYLAVGMEVDFIFLEPIQDFVVGTTSEKENLLTDLCNQLKRLAPELDVGIVIIAHANDDGEAKYCRSIVQSAAYEIRLERNAESENVLERNKTNIYIGRKNRTGGGTLCSAGSLEFNIDSYTLQPVLDLTYDDKEDSTTIDPETGTYDDEIPF